MGSYQNDRCWSDQFIPEIKRIVGPLLLEESPLEVDMRNATDLIILNARDVKIACRIRRARYNGSFTNQFTIRSRRDSGARTEYGKIVNGFGDWMFYGREADDSKGFDRWMIINLAHFRAQLINNFDSLRCGECPNGDGTYFYWFDAASFEPDPPIIVASSHPVVPLPRKNEFEEVPF
jgi:hypothetical protein